jgi:hypothetical protein
MNANTEMRDENESEKELIILFRAVSKEEYADIIANGLRVKVWWL